MIAALIKPQLGILVPLLAVVTIRRALLAGARILRRPARPDDPGDDAPVAGPTRRLARAWCEVRTDRPVRILTTGLAGS